MAAITRTRTVPADQQAVWDVLADFGALSSWMDRVDHSAVLNEGADGPMGTSRRVQIGRNTLVETITDYLAPTTLAYDIEGMPPRLGRLNNRWTLQSAGPDTVIALTGTVTGGAGALLVSRAMAKMADELLDSLARRMETHREP